MSFAPESPPLGQSPELSEYLARFEQRLLASFETVYDLPKTYVEPNKRSDGMLRYADGVSWDPGFGKGLYLYEDDVWKFYGFSIENEIDPVFTASPAGGIAAGDIVNWNTAFSWGDHAGLYLPLTGGTVSGDLTVTGGFTSPGIDDTDAALVFAKPWSLTTTTAADEAAVTITNNEATVEASAILADPKITVRDVSASAVETVIIGRALNVGAKATTESASLRLGSARTGTGFSNIDWYSNVTDVANGWGARIIRNNTTTNPATSFFHRGAGLFQMWALDGADIRLGTGNLERLRVTSAGDVLIGTTTDAGDYKLQISGNQYISGSLTVGAELILSSPTVPASASATGTAGQIAWDSTHLYVCVATDTWKRVQIDTWT